MKSTSISEDVYKLIRRPPHGGRGLKYGLEDAGHGAQLVAPHTGGVD